MDFKPRFDIKIGFVMAKTTIENQYIINYFRKNAKNIWSVSEMFVLLRRQFKR